MPFVFVIFGCNSNHGNKRDSAEMNNNNKCFVYPPTVDSLHIRDLYDSARWYVYIWHCDQNYFSKRDTFKSITFGELPLSFDNLILKHDTIELNFSFLDNLQPILPSMTRDNKELNTGIAFNLKTKRKIYMLSPNGYSAIVYGGNNRYENPVQLEVLAYMKNNWNKLDTCFRELAQQKKIIKKG
jgi:hypothetical protein